MKHRFLSRWMLATALSLLAALFPLAQYSVSASGMGGFHAGVQRMNGVAPAKASWRVVGSPNPGGDSSIFNGVAVASATDVWAVGGKAQALIEHYSK